MTEAMSPAQRAIDSAPARLNILLANGWKEAHVASEETEIFIASNLGGPNPMREVTTWVPPVATGELSGTTVRAPHIGTIVFADAIDIVVSKGPTVAQIGVLDAIVVVFAPIAGRITSAHASTDSLIQFNMPILSLLESVE